MSDKALKTVVLVVHDPRVGRLGHKRHAETLASESPLVHTLRRAVRVPGAHAVVVVHPPETPPEFNDADVTGGVAVHRFAHADAAGNEATARLTSARKWATGSWRAGLASTTCWDELLPAAPLLAALVEHDAHAAVLVGGDWCAFDPVLAGKLLELHLSAPQAYRMTFTQSPPGLGALVMARSILESMAKNQATFGGTLAYQPTRPAIDPIGREVNLPIAAELRDTAQRFIFDTPEAKRRLHTVAQTLGPRFAQADAVEIAATARAAQGPALPDTFDTLPPEIVVELTTRRLAVGPIAPQFHADIPDVDMDSKLARCVVAQLEGRLVTFGGLGDPTLHPDFSDLVNATHDAGAAGLHVSTDLLGDSSVDAALIALPLDIVSVNLHADTAATYEHLMGVDCFKEVLTRMQGLFDARSAAGRADSRPVGLPWVIPRLIKTADNLVDLETFFNRWMQVVGHALVERAPRGGTGDHALMPDLNPVPMDPPWIEPAPGQMKRRLHVRATGEVTLCAQDWQARASLGNLRDATLSELWSRVSNTPLSRYSTDESPVCRHCLDWWTLRKNSVAGSA
ncbi:MAG: SPASM domain-containing protein [Algisphaera sp.]